MFQSQHVPESNIAKCIQNKLPALVLVRETSTSF